MKNLKYIFTLIILVIISSCSSVKVLETWKSDDIHSIKTQNVLVIARTAHTPSRIAFEDAIAKVLSKKKINATESYKRYPNIDPNKNLTPKDIEELKKEFKNLGFNAVVL